MCPEFDSGQSAPASLPGRAQGACSYMSPAPLIDDDDDDVDDDDDDEVPLIR